MLEAPSPKSHSQEETGPIDLSLKWTVRGAIPDCRSTDKVAEGGIGIGVGVGAGVAAGGAVGMGVGATGAVHAKAIMARRTSRIAQARSFFTMLLLSIPAPRWIPHSPLYCS